MQRVKFKEPGRWAEVNPAAPQFDVVAGEVREVSDELARIIVDADKGEKVRGRKPTPPEADKKAAESGGKASKGE